MLFSELLNQAAASIETRANVIADSQFTCTYGEATARLDEIDVFLDLRGIDASVCLAVECTNSLAGALLLLALMRRGNSFALFPPDNTGQKPTPHFCSYRIVVAPALPGDATFAPVPYLRAEPNPLYNGRQLAPATLYLRTSGSMGASKIVVHSHAKLIGNARNVVRKYGFSSISRAVIPVPIAHMYGFGAEFLPAVLAGSSIDLQEKTNLLRYLDREKRFRPTIAFATPTICEMLLKGFKTPRTGFEVFVTSGQRISEELFRAFDPCVGGKLINQYGSTEMGATAACDPGDDLDRRVHSIGTPMHGVHLKLDPDGGELLCQHPYGFEGYLDENGDWLQRAASDGWYRTGDVAAQQPDGSIVILGRADASVNRRGYLVLLSDIERVMEKLENVGEVVVVAGQGESSQGQRIAAFCVPRPGMPANAAELRQRCFDLLPQHAIPDEVRLLETLPMLPSGKVDRRMLADLVR